MNATPKVKDLLSKLTSADKVLCGEANSKARFLSQNDMRYSFGISSSYWYTYEEGLIKSLLHEKLIESKPITHENIKKYMLPTSYVEYYITKRGLDFLKKNKKKNKKGTIQKDVEDYIEDKDSYINVKGRKNFGRWG
jgi:hypothetical protein